MMQLSTQIHDLMTEDLERQNAWARQEMWSTIGGELTQANEKLEI